MVKKLLNKKKMKKGFTLIELIIVMAVIAILAAIAVPQYLEIKEKSRVKADVANAKVIYDVTKQLIADDGIELPTSGSTPVTLESSAASPTEAAKKIINQIDNKNIWPQSKFFKSAKKYIVNISNNGDVTVDICGNSGKNLQAYPDDEKSSNVFSSKYTGKYRDFKIGTKTK